MKSETQETQEPATSRRRVRDHNQRRHLRTLERRRRAFELHTGPEKLTFPQIARRLGIGLSTAQRHYYAEVKAIHRRQVDPEAAMEMRLRLAKTYDEILAGSLERMRDPRSRSAQHGLLALKAAEQFGKLYKVTDISEPVGEPPKARYTLLKRVAEVSPGLAKHLEQIEAIEAAAPDKLKNA